MAAAVSLGLLGVAACSGGTTKELIPPPPSTVERITTAPAASDYTGVALDGVPGKVPVEDVKVLGGDATLTGIVLGPDGPVGGATIRLERFVGDAMGRLDITANADGTWAAPQLGPPTTLPTVPTLPTTLDPAFPDQVTTLPTTTTTRPPPPSVTKPPIGPIGILGGRYRIRAWRTPDMALTVPQILFVEGRQTKQVPLQLLRYTGTSATAISNPDPPVLGETLNITAVVSSASVDGEGVVRALPAPNLDVSLSVGPGLELESGATITNGQGRAAFQLRCVALGQSAVDLVVGGAQLFNLPLRPCVAPLIPSSTGPFDPTGSSTTPFPGGGSTPTSASPPTT